MLSFFSDLQLNYQYFWKICRPEGYMKIRTASEIVYSLYCMVLQENRFCSPATAVRRSLKNAPDQPEHMVEYCEEFLPHTGG